MKSKAAPLNSFLKGMTHEQKQATRIMLTAFVLSISFTIAFRVISVIGFIAIFIITLISLGIHAISHKYTAIELSMYSDYNIWPTGLIISLLSSFLGIGIIFAPTGAQEFSFDYYKRWGRRAISINLRHRGLVAIAGIMLTILIGAAFLMLSTNTLTVMGKSIFLLGAKINFLMAISSLIPIRPLDGIHIMRFSPGMWFFSLAIAIVMFWATGL